MKRESVATQCTTIPLRFYNDDFKYDYLELIRQINILQKEKEKTDEREKMINSYVANVVHDIRTPINAVRGFARLLLDPTTDNESKIKFAEIIFESSDKLLNLVNDLLDLSKIEGGQLSIVEKSGNIKELFDELYELFNNSNLPQKNGRIAIEYFIGLNPEQYIIEADFLRLRQVLINLIDNALKFTDKGYVNYGCCLSDSKTLCFYVEDTGIGISLEEQAVIFDRFKQVYDLSSKYRCFCSGTGLGLSIVKQLVELMNGRVWVESDKGLGSRFYFSLPYKKSNETHMYCVHKHE